MTMRAQLRAITAVPRFIRQLEAAIPPGWIGALEYTIAVGRDATAGAMGPEDPPLEAWAVFDVAARVHALPAELFAALAWTRRQVTGETWAEAAAHAVRAAAPQLVASRAAGVSAGRALESYVGGEYQEDSLATLTAAVLAVYVIRRAPDLAELDLEPLLGAFADDGEGEAVWT